MATKQRADGGYIALLNGSPRSGKSSIARALQAASATPTINLGVDSTMACTPPDQLPGIGLRPGGERPELEGFLQNCYRALFDSIAAYGHHGIGVVADLGVHDGYSRPLHIWREAAERLAGLPAYVIGVRCSIERILERRAADPARYQVSEDGRIPDAVLRWEEAVHDPGWYDFEVDTTHMSSADCAHQILAEVETTRPSALARHRGRLRLPSVDRSGSNEPP